MKRIKPYHLISLSEKYLIKAMSYFDKKPKSTNKQKQKKKRKKNLKIQVEYLYGDLSKSEQKGMIQELEKRNAEIPKSKGEAIKRIETLKHIERLKALEQLRNKDKEKDLEL